MPMTPKSAKAKGRSLQNLTRDTLRKAFPSLEDDDIKGATMGTNGEDIVLSPAARRLIPFSFECKARKGVTSLYNWYAQAEGNATGIPVVVVKGDRKEPLAVLKLSHFVDLIKPKET